MSRLLVRTVVVVLAVSAALLAGAASAPADPPSLSVTSVAAGSATPTNASELDLLVTFSAPVDPSTLEAGQTVQLTSTGTAAGSIASLDFDSTSNTLDVHVTGAAGDGTLGLRLAGDSTSGNPVIAGLDGTSLGTTAQTPSGSDYASGAIYTLDDVAPTVTSIARLDPSPTDAVSVRYLVTASEPIVGVDVAAFGLTATANAAGTVAAVTPTSPSTYVVRVDEARGPGTLDLSLVDPGSITDVAGNPLASDVPAGETYTLLSPAPAPTGTPSSSAPTTTSPTPRPGASHPAACASRRTVLVHLIAPPGMRLRRAALRLDGRLVTTLGPGATTAPVSLVGRPAGIATLTIQATTTTDLHLISRRRFHPCSPTRLPPGRRTALHRDR